MRDDGLGGESAKGQLRHGMEWAASYHWGPSAEFVSNSAVRLLVTYRRQSS